MEKRKAELIRAVKTPLGYFTLIVLVVEAIIGGIIPFTSGQDRTFLIIGMLVIILCLIIIVAFMAFFRPYTLYGLTAAEAQKVQKVRADIMVTPSDINRYNILFHGFSDCLFRAFNAPFKVEGEPGDPRFQSALETHKKRYNSGVTSYYLFFNREHYSRAQSFFQKLKEELGWEKEKLEEVVKIYLWENAPSKPGYTFFIGKKKGRHCCILYPAATYRAGLPEAVVYLEGVENLVSILDTFFQEQWAQAHEEGATVTNKSTAAR